MNLENTLWNDTFTPSGALFILEHLAVIQGLYNYSV